MIVAALPELWFLKDTDGDGKADFKVRMLQGLSSADSHHSANAMLIGPDGWLYWSRGIFNVAAMETPTKTYRSAESGVHRFNPRTFEMEFHFPIGPNPHGDVFDQWGYQFANDGTGGSGSYVNIGKGVGNKPWFKMRVRPVAATGILSSSQFPDKNQGNFLICNCIGFLGVLQHEIKYNGAQITAEEIEPILVSSDPNFRPTDVEIGGDGALYVSDWSERRISVVDPVSLRVVARIPVGEHPNQIAFHPTDDRLFVACASSNGVWVIDTKRGIVTETIYTALFPRSPEGSTPDALAISPDGETLYVANADNNCIAVIEVEHPNKSTVKGFIPTGWYPTAVAVTPDGKNLLVGVGKGNQSKANPIPKVEVPDSKLTETEKVVKKVQPFPYIGTTMSGALSVVPIPDEAALKEYTQQVYRNCPYSDDLLTAVPNKVPTAIPTKVGNPSPIKYVIYVIKENRTYDQVFGDLATGDKPKGNGDPSLCMFPRNVTPNHHKLAEQFVLLDNMYCNGQVSRDGHPWSTMAYNTDYISRDWHLTYSQRLGVDDDDEGDLSNAPSGYLWDACKRAGVSYRNYKEYGSRVSDDTGNTKMEGRVPGLVGHMCPNFGIGKGRERDMDLIDVMLDEYKQFVENKNMPKFIMMSLGEDHTDGTRPGSFTPQACVGSNDIAIGKLVEAVSHGPLWAETAIFMIEDDAQNGPDHIDAHRTVSLVISPYTKRSYVDSTQYSTVSMIRTMELILGLEPLSQYDAAARPMFDSFTNVADLTPYTLEKAQINLDAKNDALAYGADRSMRMDFTEYDRIDDFELNEILWHAIMGEDAPLPPAVRRAIAFRSSAVRESKLLTP
jgi:YVTN family beta-propeller protein